MTTDFSALDAALLQEFPKFKVVLKQDSWLMRAISAFLLAVTFGKQHAFMTDFITTIGYTVYVPSTWPSMPQVAQMVILRHERVHMRQRAKYSMALFTLLYVLLPLPGGLAYFRAKFEKEAYAETLRAIADLYEDGLQQIQSEACRADMVSNFTGPSYFWMWPFKKDINDWYDSVVLSIVMRLSK